MRLKTVFLAIVGALSASAFVIPEGQEDGVYESYLENGKSVHVKLANSTHDIANNKKRDAIPASILPRDVSISCGGARNLNREWFDAAWGNLRWQCGNYGPTKPRHNYYAISGDVVAFFCNFNYRDSVQCNEGGADLSGYQISTTCGALQSGWLTNNDEWSYGYDRGRCFCGECV
ncbi:hypothetical protein BU24DRAFT_418162 [Aaosphaeria arxii CBS 175.79]|uniref:Cyanovirin-N domain-containing protein n=1 Tax=Aaosphaeria arxii CBS 175.79 TaxID=1450172 RepID=A0A6A5XZL2_9PLEO|nr:uncharacterized protein BU24DRAFT_418162 [Aaosphaeria arxii CBS 175.79]KAF2018642.1 hypothetical protein BU24DRAFT_418162 [Aaosphaeria arxii CBS 175.79]